MNDTIVVGDIHGHIKSVEMALAYDGDVVFVGDYLDSFGQSPENQVECLIMVLDAIEDEPDRVTGLLGNHELSYLAESMRCSGHNGTTARLVSHLRTRMWETLKPYHWVGDVLVTHAGVDQELLDYHDVSLADYLEYGDHNEIGIARGGYDHVGGLYWNDYNREGKPVAGIVQVCGHSNFNGGIHKYTDGIRVKYNEDKSGETWCVDNLNRVREVALIVDGEVQPYILEEAVAEEAVDAVQEGS